MPLPAAMGGGKSRKSAASRLCGAYFVIIIGILVCLSSCRTSSCDCVVGVPVRGTAWQLAAAIHDKGDGSFLPEAVHVYQDKAYIEGWYDTNRTAEPYTAEPYDDGLLPARIVCDIVNNQVVHACVYCPIMDKEE